MTPTQIAAHERHKRFHASIAERAALKPKPEVKPEPTREVLDAWASRQLQINQMKEPWFCIEGENGPPRISQVIMAVCRHFGISKCELLSQMRNVQIVRPRQIGYYLCKKLTQTSLPEIGRRFAGRDHTSVLHGVRKIEQLVKTDSVIAAHVEQITAKVRI